ncbi:diguanylate cyclase [Halopseudomonas pachastrellae]|uniref:diguanylate cyclase n=1 Tax=Halopseudomonas pachastrellae TaxID=254161 RepID=UPI003D7E20CB
MPVPAMPAPITQFPRLIFALFGIMAIALYLLWQALLDAEQEQARARLQLEADALAHQIQTRFEQQAATLLRLAERWPQHRANRDLWTENANQLLRDYHNFQAIEWLDASFRMRWIEPLNGNEAAIGLIYPRTHPNYPLLLAARDTGQPRLSNSFELVQGGLGLAYYIPLHRVSGDLRRFDGFLLGIFRVEVLINDLLSELQAADRSLRLEEQGVALYTSESDYQAAPWSVSSPVTLADNSNFVLVMQPTHQLLASTTTHLPLMVVVSGALAALLLCISLLLTMRGAQRSQQLARSNHQLQAEIKRRQDTEESLKHNQARLKLIHDMTDHSHDALFIIGLDPMEVVYLNRTCWQSLGYSEIELREVLRIAPDDVMPGAIKWLAELRNMIHSQGNAIFQKRIIRRDGRSSPLEVSVRHLRRIGRDYLICVGRDNSEQLQLAARLQQLSHQDGLTGLFNRRYFDKTLVSEWRRLRREQTPLGLLMLDVDHFKRFNDELGHQAGDDALQQVATALNSCLMREGDCVCRYGGEEFAVILPGAGPQQCVQVAERIHDAIATLGIRHPNTTVAEGLLTVSVGAASLLPQPEWSPHDLVRQADTALYRAKAAGRNRSQLAVTTDDQPK